MADAFQFLGQYDEGHFLTRYSHSTYGKRRGIFRDRSTSTVSFLPPSMYKVFPNRLITPAKYCRSTDPNALRVAT